MLRRLATAVLLAFVVAVPAAHGFGLDEVLKDPAQEARAREVQKSLRCLVCQNQSIDDSDAPLARDLRRIVRERIVAGDSDDEVRRFVVARYGDWVLLKPPLKGGTYVLWFGPILMILMALAGLIYFFRRGRNRVPIAALSEAESERLDSLLDEG